MVAGTGALVTLIVVKLWPKNSDAPERLGTRILSAWRRLSGMDDPVVPSDRA
jgi:hypothetical protein